MATPALGSDYFEPRHWDIKRSLRDVSLSGSDNALVGLEVPLRVIETPSYRFAEIAGLSVMEGPVKRYLGSVGLALSLRDGAISTAWLYPDVGATREDMEGAAIHTFNGVKYLGRHAIGEATGATWFSAAIAPEHVGVGLFPDSRHGAGYALGVATLSDSGLTVTVDGSTSVCH